MPPVQTCPGVPQWQQFLDGLVNQDAARLLEGHLSSCRTCQDTLAGVRTVDELVGLLPHLKDALPPQDSEPVTKMIARFKELRPALDTNPTVPPTPDATQGGDSSTDAAAGLELLAPPQQSGELGRLGPYRVLRKLGEGGMGIVFLAEEVLLQRQVALKVMQPSQAASPLARERFLREARATAALEHDHIVPIFAVGEAAVVSGTVPYLAMPFLKGEPLDARLAREGRLPVAEVLRIGREIAEGLAAAHAAGLIHRDVKPGNIWLEGERGRVRLLDFGLVRTTAGNQPNLSQQGAIIGTPAYMAPEQVGGQPVDGRADLFSLGCVLYALATGKQPFLRDNVMATLTAVLTETPEPPCKLEPSLPAGLGKLIERLLSKSTNDRPASAAEVSRQLEQLAVQPLTPRRRRRVLVGLLAGGVLAAALAGVVLLLPSRKGEVRIETDDPNIELIVRRGGGIVRIRDKRTGQSWDLDAEAYTLARVDEEDGLRIELPGKGPLRLRRPGGGVVTITRIEKADEVKGKPVPFDPAPLKALVRRGLTPADRALYGLGDPELSPVELAGVLGDARFRHVGLSSYRDWSPDGSLLAVPGGDSIFLFDASGRLVRLLRGHAHRVMRVAFSGDGKWLASASDDQTVRLWDPAMGKPLRVLVGHKGWVWGVAFSPDGKLLASSGHDRSVRLWEPATGKEVHRFEGLAEGAWNVAFSGEGTILAAAVGDNTVRLWDVATHQPLHTLRHGSTADVLSVAFSPDGRWLASANNGRLLLWDARTLRQPKVRQRHALADAGLLAGFSPDSRFVWTARHQLQGSAEVRIRSWNIEFGKEERSFSVPVRGGWFQANLRPDGQAVLYSTEDEESVLRQADAAGKPMPADVGHLQEVSALAFSPDGKTLASAAHDSTVRLWDLATGRTRHVLREHKGFVQAVAYSPDGKLLATSGQDSFVRLWDATTGRHLWSFSGHTRPVDRVTFSPDGRHVLSGGWDGIIRCWDVARRTPGPVFTGFKSGVSTVAFSPNGEQVAGSSHDRTVQVFEFATGRRLRSFQHPTPVYSVAFLPDGDEIVTGGADGVLRVWSVSRGELCKEVRTQGSVLWGLAVRREGPLVAASGHGGIVHLLDLSLSPPGRHSIRLAPYSTDVQGIAFSPDGRFLAAGNPDGTIALLRLTAPGSDSPLRLPAWKPTPVVRSFSGHSGEGLHVRFSKDGKRLFSAGADKTARIWDTDSGEELHCLKHPMPVIRAFPADSDRLLVTDCEDNVVRVWNVQTGQPVRQLDQERLAAWMMNVTPDGKRLLIPSFPDSKHLLLYDLSTGKQLRRYPGAGGGIAFSPDGKQAFLPGDNPRLLDLETGTVLQRFDKHRDWVRDAAVSPDGRLGLTCSGPGGSFVGAGGPGADCSLRLWDLKTGVELRRWEQGVWTRYACCFTPDSKRAVSGCSDGSVGVFDVATGREVVRIEAPVCVYGVAVSPDGKHVVASCTDGVLRMYAMPPAR